MTTTPLGSQERMRLSDVQRSLNGWEALAQMLASQFTTLHRMSVEKGVEPDFSTLTINVDVTKPNAFSAEPWILSRVKVQANEAEASEPMTVVLNGEPFSCECGGNIFIRRARTYRCNSCGTLYQGA